MASKPVTLKVQPRGKPIHRLRITQGKGTAIPNDKNVTVASTELQDGDTIQVKDLGPQIAWRTLSHGL